MALVTVLVFLGVFSIVAPLLIARSESASRHAKWEIVAPTAQGRPTGRILTLHKIAQMDV
jgi:hypothetical protein